LTNRAKRRAGAGRPFEKRHFRADATNQGRAPPRDWLAKQRFFNDLDDFLRAARYVRRSINVDFLYKQHFFAGRLYVYRPLKH
jgi:hypothetical protein